MNAWMTNSLNLFALFVFKRNRFFSGFTNNIFMDFLVLINGLTIGLAG